MAAGWRALVAKLDLMTGGEHSVPRKFRIAFTNRRAARDSLETHFHMARREGADGLWKRVPKLSCRARLGGWPGDATGVTAADYGFV